MCGSYFVCVPFCITFYPIGVKDRATKGSARKGFPTQSTPEINNVHPVLIRSVSERKGSAQSACFVTGSKTPNDFRFT